MIGTFNLPITSTGATLTGFITEWLASGDTAARTIALPLVNTRIEGALTYDCIVYWGDNTSSTIKSFNDANSAHTYATSGTFQINIVGTCEGFSFNNVGDKLKITKVVNIGGPPFNGFKYLKAGFYGCTNLTTLGTNPIKPSGTGILTDGFYQTFSNCLQLSGGSLFSDIFRYNPLAKAFNLCFQATTLTYLPTDIFRYNTAVTSFNGLFYQAAGNLITYSDMFRYNTSVTDMASVFRGMPSLTGISADIFKYNTNVTSFANAFDGSGLKSIPVDLFRYNTKVTNFGATFAVTPILGVPDDIFRYNSGATSFSQTFASCTSLSAVTVDMFRYNVNVSNFGSVFDSDTALASVPADLFRYNTGATTISFTASFYGCNKLQLNTTMFGLTGDTATRFAGKTVNFTNCFNRATFTGTQGTAPELWNYTYGTLTSTSCFAGAGNSLTSLTNYGSVPVGWK
jgi:hypothetical protein